jgi:hypothetical protein
VRLCQKSFFKGNIFKVAGNASKGQFNDPNLGRPGLYVVEPDEQQAIPVQDCEGLLVLQQ